MRNRRAIAAIATVLITGCSLLVNSDDLSGGGITSEAGAGEATTEDRGAVGNQDDANQGLPNDAGDAAPEGSYCQTLTVQGTRFFCEDFDTEDPSAAIPSFTTGNGKLSIVNKALRAEVDPLDGGSGSYAIVSVSRSLNVVPKRIHAALDFTVTKNSSFLNLVSLSFQLTGPNRTGVISFQVSAEGFRIVEQVDFGGSDDFRAHNLTTRVWPTTAPIHIDFTWHDKFTFDLLVNGVELTKDQPLFPSWGKGPVTLHYGVGYANGFGNSDVTLDSLSVEGDL